METKILTLVIIFLFCITSYSQEHKGFYAKASANITYPIPGIIGSIGYEFNKHFAIGIGGGVISGCLL